MQKGSHMLTVLKEHFQMYHLNPAIVQDFIGEFYPGRGGGLHHPARLM